MIRRALIGGVAAALVLVALAAGAQSADEHASHHPGGGAPAAPAAPPGATGMAGMPAAGVPAAPAMGAMTAPGIPAAPATMSGTAAPGVLSATAMAPGAPMGTPVGPFAVPGTAATPAPGVPAGAGMAGMAGMMASMMAPGTAGGGCVGGNCGAGAVKTPIYPSLMTLPALTPQKRDEIEALAIQQINEGLDRLARGAESLQRAAETGDNVAMQQSVGLMREGLDEFGSGIAARRVLTEGKAPRNLALDWFKREMNLASPIADEGSRPPFGLTLFHFFTMAILITFALAMVGMYFLKMRRAAALFGRLESDDGPPPPGGLPPPPATPAPSSPAAPPTEKPPSAAGSATPPATPSPTATPATGTPVAPTVSPGGTAAVSASEVSSPAPVTSNWRGPLRIGSIITETPSVKTFRLLPSPNAPLLPFTFVPGQFLNVAFSIGGARMNRSYSISSSPTQRDCVDLTVRREPRGAVSRHIFDLLEVGDLMETQGPVGRFTFTGTEADSIVLISGGVGITPMVSITRYLTEHSWAGEIFFVYVCRTPTDFMFAGELAALQHRNPKLHVVVTMTRPEGTDWKGPRGRLTKELLTQTVPNLASRRVHLCGPPTMMESTRAILAELGVPADRLKTEAFGATKPTPAAAGTTAKPAAPATGPLVTFSKNNKSAKIHVDLQRGDSPPKQTILELSEEIGIGIEFSCRVGTCGVCKVKMTSGEVEMAIEDALDPSDKTNGIILACQAKPKGEISVEA